MYGIQLFQNVIINGVFDKLSKWKYLEVGFWKRELEK